MNNLRSPIFIIGCPRSGTSILLQLLASHSQLGYINSFVNRRPARPELSMLNLLYDLPWLGGYFYSKQLRYRFLPSPREPWISFNNYLSYFQLDRDGDEPPRERPRYDLTEEEAARFRTFVKKVLAYQHKDRFLCKYTDFPRIDYMSRIFPDAVFIHILRDGRAVANSYLEQINHGGFNTWEEREWWLRGWPDGWAEEWINRYGTKLSFCGYQWRYFVGMIEKQGKNIPEDRLFKVRYEDLVDSPKAQLTKLMAFLGIDKNDRSVFDFLDRISVENRNSKWQEVLSQGQVNSLEEILAEDLIKIGYK